MALQKKNARCPLREHREKRRELAVAGQDAGLGLVPNSKQHLGGRFVNSVEGSAVSFLPKFPRHQQNHAVKATPKSRGQGRSHLKTNPGAHSTNIKECIKFERKYMENLRQVLTNYYFTMVHVHQGKPTWLRPWPWAPTALPGATRD